MLIHLYRGLDLVSHFTFKEVWEFSTRDISSYHIFEEVNYSSKALFGMGTICCSFFLYNLYPSIVTKMKSYFSPNFK